MKRILLGLFAAAAVAFGISAASASTIGLGTLSAGPNSIPSTQLPAAGAPNLPAISFTLSGNSDLVIDITFNALPGSHINITNFGLFTDPTLSSISPSGSLITGVGVLELSFTNVLAGNYLIALQGAYNGPKAFLGGIVNTASAAVTPVPGSLILFATSLVGLGVVGYRRRSTTSA